MGLVLLPNGEPATPEVETLAIEPKFKDGTSAVENFHRIRFTSKSDADRWVERCIVRWDWVIGIHDATPGADEPTYVARARKVAGAVHDTKAPLYKPESGDVKLNPYVQVVEVKPGCFAIANRH